MNNSLPNPFMARAIALAERSAENGEVPVGALIVDGATGETLAEAYNRTETDNDPSAHAELLAIRAACAKRGSPRLTGCDLYVTLEPCAMCATVISFARLRRVYYGAPDPKGGGVDHGPRIFGQPTCHHAPEIVGGLLETECGNVLRDFFKARRLEGRTDDEH